MNVLNGIQKVTRCLRQNIDQFPEKGVTWTLSFRCGSCDKIDDPWYIYLCPTTFHLFNEIKQAKISFTFGIATLKPVNIMTRNDISKVILHLDAGGCSRKRESRIRTESSKKEIPILPLILRRLANFPPQISQILVIR